MELNYKTKRCRNLTQDMFYDQDKLDYFLDFSEQQLKEAYERMDMASQPWAKGTEEEIDFIESVIKKEGHEAEILDLGCGQGRHCVELCRRGYENVCGIDFSEKNIKRALSYAIEQKVSPMLSCGDARKLNLGRKFDIVLCLYDVIGSFRQADDNFRILKTIKRHLRKGGMAVVSVMNMEMTEHIALHKTSLSQNPQAILRLPPSDTMSRSGNIFKPEYYLINSDDGLVYRKEQFSEDDMISAEYLVTDKRYRMSEFEAMAVDAGFEVVIKKYVQAGHFAESLNATDVRAKELLFVLRNA